MKMNEQLQQTINDILTQSMEAFNKGADWLAGEIPDVIAQLLIWNAVSSFLLMLFGVALILPHWKIYSSVKSECEKDIREQSELIIIGGAVYVIIGTITSLIITFSSFDWLKIWIAPKLYLLEYAADLIK